VSWETLNDMRFLTLVSRCNMIQERYNIVISRGILREVYRRNKVTYRQPKKTLRVTEAKEMELI
jgi:hypothetical protein